MMYDGLGGLKAWWPGMERLLKLIFRDKSNKSTASTAPCPATEFTSSKCHNSVKIKMCSMLCPFTFLQGFKENSETAGML